MNDSGSPDDASLADDLPNRRSDLALHLEQWTNALAQAEQEAARSPDATHRARACLTAARAKWHLDDFPGCTRLAMQCLATMDLDTPRAVSVHATTLAAFALNELGATAQARGLAQRALVRTRVELLYDLLPTALSCAAYVEACAGDLDRSEALHTEALAQARRAAGPEPLQLALTNLLLSYVEILRTAVLEGDVARVQAVGQRARRHVAQARLLKDDPQLSQWRRLSLRQSLGEFLGLCSAQPEAEELLRESLDESVALADAYLTQSIAAALAGQLEARGAYREALGLLATHVHPENPRQCGYRRRLLATRIAESCLRHLGLPEEATRASERVAQDLRQWDIWRAEAIASLPG